MGDQGGTGAASRLGFLLGKGQLRCGRWSRARASHCRFPHCSAGWHRLLMHLPVYIPPTKSSFVYGKKLFWFHVFSLNSSSLLAEWLLLSLGADRSHGACLHLLGEVPWGSPGVTQDRGLGHGAISSHQGSRKRTGVSQRSA